MTDGGATGFDDEVGWFYVVINDEEQYSIWPGARRIPAGWKEAGHRGDRASCITFVDQVWTDMRPRSVRERQDG